MFYDPESVDLLKISFAELRNLKAQVEEEAADWADFLSKVRALTADDLAYNEKKIRIREKVEAEFSRRIQVLNSLSVLSLPELEKLEDQYKIEADSWHNDFINTEHSPSAEKYRKYQREAEEISKIIRVEIDDRK